ncbi:PREDICTED: protein FAM161A [Gekko japonicus]|uniref:Protein FAM161A n=1 Tax=Gekko japonicus TaxID=146911 RepID=A0ABM1KWF9_GEKJA|nr:PREDICTED: protein FAM161A [Gekko japonicus]
MQNRRNVCATCNPKRTYLSGRPLLQDILDLNSSPERKQGSTMSDDCEDCLDPSKMHLSNQEYYLKLEELKNAHMETMAQLEKMYQNKLYLKDVQPLTKTDATRSAKHRSRWEKSSLQSRSIRKSFSESDLNYCSDSDFSVVSDVELELEKNHSEAGSLKFGNRWGELSSESFPRWTASGPFKCWTLKKSRRKKKAWSPKLTVPEPFQMTIREAKKKEQNVKSKARIEMENNLLKKQLEEEAECQKQFRANPVPASVFVPLYHDIMKRNEERRKFVKDRRREILLASQKPFSFIEREAQKNEMRKMQLRDLSTLDKKAKKFKAKPVPKFIYSPEISERLKEEELYREIRIQMRSEELLHNSSLPNSRLGNKHSSPKCLEASKTSGSKPRTTAKVPDFEMLHRKFQKQLQRQMNVKAVTVCEPFHLRTPNIPSKRGKILEDIQNDEEKLNETRWPYASPRCPPHMRSTTTASLPVDDEEPTSPRITESTRKRLQAIRDSLEEKRRQEEAQRKIRAKRKQRARKLQRLITTRAEANDPHQSLAQLYKSKLKTFRRHEKQRMKEYLQELEEMEERVEKRPLLLERATQKNARMAAEKHYSDTLRELGLCEEFVSKKGRTAKSLRAQYASSDGSENSGAEEGRSDNEIASQKGDSDGEEEKSAVQSSQSCEKAEEEEEEKSEANSDHYEQDEHESEDSRDGDVEKSSDNEELSD